MWSRSRGSDIWMSIFSLKCRNIFTYKLFHWLSGCCTIVFEKLDISDHFPSTNGKFYDVKEVVVFFRCYCWCKRQQPATEHCRVIGQIEIAATQLLNKLKLKFWTAFWRCCKIKQASNLNPSTTYLFFLKKWKKLTQPAVFMKKFKKFSGKYWIATWITYLMIDFLINKTYDGWILTGWVKCHFFNKWTVNYFFLFELSWLTSVYIERIYEGKTLNSNCAITKQWNANLNARKLSKFNQKLIFVCHFNQITIAFSNFYS